MNGQDLKENFAIVGANGVDVAEYFYADLFAREPRLRPMFPVAMAKQHKVLLGALEQIVASVDDPDTLIPYLRNSVEATGASGSPRTTTRSWGPASWRHSPTSADRPGTRTSSVPGRPPMALSPRS